MPQTLTCPECGKSFTCDPEGDCWCKSYAPIPIPETLRSDTCLCPCVLERLRQDTDTHFGPTLKLKRRLER